MIFQSPTRSLERGCLLRKTDIRQIEKTKLHLLKDHLQQALKSQYYGEIFSSIGLNPQDIRQISDLQGLPLTGREELAKRGQDFIPANATVCDISQTSGTTGNPVIVPYTKSDLHRLAYNEAMAFLGAGISKKDRVLLTVTLDKGFIAGLAYYGGAVMLGASAIRSGPGHPAQHWKLIATQKPTILLGVPSYLLALARWANAEGFNTKKTSLRSLVTIGEPVQNWDLSPSALGTILKDAWGIPVFSSYGATEVETAFGDCRFHLGGHVHPELMIVEVIDENGRNVPDSTPGEVTVTPLGVEGFPLVRFKTGDISRLHSSPCKCGWTTERLGPIEGRISQRLKFKGTTLYPDMILQALQSIKGTDDSYITVEESFDLSDNISLVIGTEENTLSISDIQSALQAHLRVTPRVIFENRQKVIEKTGKGRLRKPKRFFDYRNQAAASSENPPKA